MTRHNLILFLFVTLFSSQVTAGLFDPIGWVRSQVEPAVVGKGVYVTWGEDKQKLLLLKEEKVELEQNEKTLDAFVGEELERIERQVTPLKEKIKGGSTNDFLHKKLSLLNEQHQTLIDTQLSCKQEITSLDQQIKTLEDYLRDPDFKGLSLEAKSFYSFENLQNLAQKIADQDELMVHSEEQKNTLTVELENRKKHLEQVVKDLKNKEREQKEGIRGEGLLNDEGFDAKQRSEILDLTLRLLGNKKQLAEQKVDETKRKLGLAETKLFIEREKRKILNDQRINVKEGLRVEEPDIQKERTALEHKRQEYLDRKDDLYQERTYYETQRNGNKKTLEELAQKFGIAVADLNNLDERPFEAIDADGFYALSLMFNCKETVVYCERRMDFVDAKINLEDAKFESEEIAVKFIDSWHKLTTHKFRSEAEVESDINKYYEPAKINEQKITTITEEKVVVTNTPIRNKAFENLRQELRRLEEHFYLFKNNPDEYAKSVKLLRQAVNMANPKNQIDFSRHITEVYSNIIQLRSSIKHKISGIIAELQSIGLRPPNAITLEGIKNIPSDIAMLWGEIVRLGTSYFKEFTGAALVKTIKAAGLLGVLRFLIKLLFLFLLFYGLRASLPTTSARLLTVSRDAGNLYFIGRFLAGVLNFIQHHFKSLFVWFICYMALCFDVIPDAFPRVIFYLLSIPFLLLMSRSFLRYFRIFNASQEYLFVSKVAVDRLFTVVTVLLYATISIFFFRQAFMLASYSKSELPTILLALYSIIVRIVLISLIRKEDILDVIPTEGWFWEKARVYIEKHFYPIFAFLVLLIVMSEPHVGYGKYISYVLWGVIGTIILIRVLMIVNLLVRRFSTTLFFRVEGDISRERFVYAKTAYGLFVICSFVVLALFALMTAARIWGYSITLTNISDLLSTPLFTVGERTTDQRDITAISILQMLGFIIGSFVGASAINHFVLKRVFDLLIVDQGVQYTISTIMHYVIVAIIITIGFKRMGLIYAMVIVIAPVLISLTWSLRAYADDFVSYFIILVQRPFKIGDYVKLDNNIMGVVRKITPRSVIIREKNSINVLIPNTKVVQGHITNWNYTRSFTAFPDIFIAVPFSADPTEIRSLVARILDANMNVLKNPKPVIRLDDFSENGFVFMIRGYLSSDNVANMFDIASDVRFALTKTLKEHNIVISSPAILYKEAI